MKKVLMVCLGNICRSPLAQGLLEKKIQSSGVEAYVDSAGTGHWHIGKRPDRRSIAVGEKNGIDIKHQRARQFKSYDLDDFDLILTMDKRNYNAVQEMCENQEQREKVSLIMSYAFPGEERVVPDPFKGEEENFKEVFQTLDMVTDQLVAQLK